MYIHSHGWIKGQGIRPWPSQGKKEGVKPSVGPQNRLDQLGQLGRVYPSVKHFKVVICLEGTSLNRKELFGRGRKLNFSILRTRIILKVIWYQHICHGVLRISEGTSLEEVAWVRGMDVISLGLPQHP